MLTLKHLDLLGTTHPKSAFGYPVLSSTHQNYLIPTPQNDKFPLKYYIFEQNIIFLMMISALWMATMTNNSKYEKNARLCKSAYEQNRVQFLHFSHVMSVSWKSRNCRYQNSSESSKKGEIFGKKGRKCQKWHENMLLSTQVLRSNRFGQTPTTPSMTSMLLSTDPHCWKWGERSIPQLEINFEISKRPSPELHASNENVHPSDQWMFRPTTKSLV